MKQFMTTIFSEKISFNWGSEVPDYFQNKSYSLVLPKAKQVKEPRKVITPHWKLYYGVHDFVIEIPINYIKSLDAQLPAYYSSDAQKLIELMQGNLPSFYESQREEIKKKIAQIEKLISNYHYESVKPIHKAVEDGNLEEVKKLISKKVELEVRNNYNATPLELAVRFGRLEIVNLLLSAGAKIDNMLVFMAASDGKLEIVNRLLVAGADINSKNSQNLTLLQFASRENQITLVKLLIEKGADLNIITLRNLTALSLAAFNDRLEVANLLLMAGVDPNICSPLHVATERGHINMVKLLFSKGADPNKGNSPLSAVLQILEKKKEQAEVVIDGRAIQTLYVNPKEYAKWREMIKLFLENKCDFNAGKDSVDNTLFHYAASNGDEELVKWLLPRMDPNIRNKDGKSPLFFATYSLKPGILELFSATSDVNANVEATTDAKQVQPKGSPIRSRDLSSENKPFATLEISFSITQKELTLDKELGRGGFGIVFKGKWQHTDVAIKQLQATQLSEKALEEFQSEMKLMASLNYPNIVRLFGITDSVPYCMVMEYMPKGDLYNLLHSKEQLSADQVAKIALDIARGMAYLHQRNIMHRDLKSKNILLDDELRAKVADFGLAKIRTETQTSSTKNIVGTLAWMAPEIILGETYTLKADIYSFGVILWEISVRETPFAKANGNQVLIATWKSIGKKDEIPKDTPEKLAKLIEASWVQEPEKRPTAEQAVQQLQTENTATSSVPKSNEYRSNLDSTKSENYRGNFDSDNNSFRP